MTTSPLQLAESLQIGTVDFVSPDQIKVLLDIEAPEAVALNSGSPRAFPRVHNYVLISLDGGYLVGQIEWLTVERSAFPKRKGYRDFGVVDLPFPLRKMSVNPLGTVTQRSAPPNSFIFRRGAESLPTIGSRVLLPSESQLRAVIQSAGHHRVVIGTSRLAAHAEVWVDPDRIFGRHLAVLGNTGSGKSCSVAGLIRWSIEAARRSTDAPVNARFLILDPNGEYSRAFSGGPDDLPATVFRLDPPENDQPLSVPLWFWSSSEWASFTRATARTQAPLLKRALRDVKAGRRASTDDSLEKRLRLRRYLSSALIGLRRDLRSGAIRSEATKFGYALRTTSMDLREKLTAFPDNKLDQVIGAISDPLNEHHATFTNDQGKTVNYFRPFEEAPIREVIAAFEDALETLGGILPPDGPDEDVPIPFDGGQLADHLQMLAEQEGVTQFVDFLVSRMRSLLADAKIRQVVEGDTDTTLEEWLGTYLGRDEDPEEQLVIIDLSLVPSEAVHVVIAVLARMVFEALQRYMKINGKPLPTVLVMEEAHTFVKRYRGDGESEDPAKVCCQVFERIAREGRKFGLGLVLSSQRPSELSPTVLSQCNTFLLHRISNDRDQEIVHRLVPDNLRGLLRELPSLPSQNAILLGWASDLPVLVRMNDLPQSQQPHSDDPDFWDVWLCRDIDGNVVDRPAKWSPVAREWQRYEFTKRDDHDEDTSEHAPDEEDQAGV